MDRTKILTQKPKTEIKKIIITKTLSKMKTKEIKNTYCFNPADGMRGTVVSNALFGTNNKQNLCNVIWEDGQHSTEKIENIDITTEVNTNPPAW